MGDDLSRGCVVVFGREPVPGCAKTRLATHVGAKTAADVYAVLLEHAVAEALGSGLDTILELAEVPSRGWTAPHEVPWIEQQGDDLGARMQAAFERCFAAGFERVVLVGTDIPGLDRLHLRRAIRLLEQVPVVLGPARDGGYYLVAQRAPGAPIFGGVPWSVPETLAATHQRLLDLSLGHAELATLADVDRFADLQAALQSPDLAPDLEAALSRALTEE